MVSAAIKRATISTVALLGATAAYGADYSPPQPSCYDAAVIASGRAPPGAVPCYVPPPPVVVEEFGAWYLRGDIGMSNQSVKNLNNALYAGNSIQAVGMGFDSAPTFGLGVGYYFNDWLRFDVTGEYRGRANFHGLDIVRSGGNTYTDQYTGSKSEWLFLGNAYVDLGTWNSLTPFIGAGLGFSRNTIHSFVDTCAIVAVCTGGSVATGADNSKWNFAWALHAGVSYRVTKNFAVELSYRYVSLGDAASGDLVAYNGTNAIYNPMEFNKLTSHDFRLGLRMNLDALWGPRYQPLPPQQTVYAPPPQPTSYQVYAQAPGPALAAPPTVQAAPQQSYQQQGYGQPVYAQQPAYAQSPYSQQPLYAPRR